MLPLIWGVLAGLFLILEVLLPGLVSIWFSISAFVLLFLSFYIKAIHIQVLIFSILSISLLVLSRKYLKTYIAKDREEFNAELIGETVLVTKIISDNKYEVSYKGIIWSAISNEKFELNDVAKIDSFKGNKIIIKRGV